MSKKLSEMTLEELWQLFPIVLTEHDPKWASLYAEEVETLKSILPCEAEFYHIGSTAIDGIVAKPIIDIIVAVETLAQIRLCVNALLGRGYILMSESESRASLNKGYTENGFAEKVYHLHIRLRGDTDEVLFRDYLNAHPDAAKRYEALKLGLWKRFEHDRDGYTAAKTEFVKKYTELAKLSYTSNMKKFPYRKILVVGCGGAGKSTLAVELGRALDIPVVHLDRLWWLADWVHRTEAEFDRLLEKELAAPSWIMDGNFNRTFARRLSFAEFCIFLDYPTELCLASVRERCERFKGTTRPDMTEGCVEQFDPEFEAWIRSYRDDVRPAMLKTLIGSNVPHKIFESREQTAEWLASIR